MSQKQSDVETFYYAIRTKMRGNLYWEDLSPVDQIRFVEAVNVILQLTSARFTNADEPVQ